ncbi:MAG TPA: hypothetical protein VGC59_01075, partial [Solirubrobacteraceae bacterium]
MEGVRPDVALERLAAVGRRERPECERPGPDAPTGVELLERCDGVALVRGVGRDVHERAQGRPRVGGWGIIRNLAEATEEGIGGIAERLRAIRRIRTVTRSVPAAESLTDDAVGQREHDQLGPRVE